MRFLALFSLVSLALSTVAGAASVTASTSGVPGIQYSGSRMATESVGLNPPSLLSPSSDGTLEVTLTGDFDDASGLEFASVKLDSYVVDAALNRFTAGSTFVNGGSTSSVIKMTYTIPKAILAGIVGDGVVDFFSKASANVNVAGRGSFFAATLSYSAVPEPSTMAILGLGTLALVRFRRRGSK